MADFVKAADLSDLAPGNAMEVEVAGKSIALFNVEGTVYALDNTCIHRGGPLGEGDLEDEVVTCPWHAWQYNVKTGENVAQPGVKMASYPVRIEGGSIQVAV